MQKSLSPELVQRIREMSLCILPFLVVNPFAHVFDRAA